jgi:hypothetical protein
MFMDRNPTAAARGDRGRILGRATRETGNAVPGPVGPLRGKGVLAPRDLGKLTFGRIQDEKARSVRGEPIHGVLDLPKRNDRLPVRPFELERHSTAQRHSAVLIGRITTMLRRKTAFFARTNPPTCAGGNRMLSAPRVVDLAISFIRSDEFVAARTA